MGVPQVRRAEAAGCCCSVEAIVRPVLEYAAEIWAGDMGAKEMRAAEKVQTDFARTMLGSWGARAFLTTLFGPRWAWRSSS